MPRKRKSVPQRADDAKRQLMSWNLFDQEENLSVHETEVSAVHHDLATSQQGNNGLQTGISTAETNTCVSSWGILDSVLQSLIDESSFYLTVLKDPTKKPNEHSYKLATLKFKLTSADGGASIQDFPEVKEFWIYINTNGTHIVYFETNFHADKAGVSSRNSVLYFLATSTLDLDTLEGLQLKYFPLIFSGYNQAEGDLYIDLFVVDTGLTKLKFSCEAWKPRKFNIAMQAIMSHLYSFTVRDYSGKSNSLRHDINGLYDEVKSRHQSCQGNHIKVNVQHPSLKPRLRPYQRDAVCWMLKKERMGQCEDKKSGSLHFLYEEFTSPEGHTFYYNRHGGYMVVDKPLAMNSPPGGILADEMGLGKTVEVLSCMLAHPRTDVPPVEALPVIKEEAKHTDTSEQTQVLEDPMIGDTLVGSIVTGGKEIISEVQESGPLSCSEPNIDTTAAETKATSEAIVINLEEQKFISEEKPKEEKEDASQDYQNLPICIRDHDYTSLVNVLATSISANVDEEQRNTTLNTTSFDANKSGLRELVTSPEKQLFVEEDSIPPVTVESTPQTNHSIEEITIQKTKKGKRRSRKQKLKTVDSMQTSLLDVHEREAMVDESAVTSNELTPKPAQVPDVSLDGDQYRPTLSNAMKKKGKKGKPKKAKKDMSAAVPAPAPKTASEILFNKSKNTGSHENRVTDTNVKKKGRRTKKSRKQKTGFVEYIEDDEGTKATFFDGTPAKPQQYFECICGEQGTASKAEMEVQCGACGLFQHPECVHYDLKDPYRGKYLCPHCHVASEPVPSGATLIISPSAICYQWVDEITKHIQEESLKVFVYTGVHKQGFIQPQTLANKDIVITTYETLRKEINYVDLPHSNSSAGRRFRHPKRFMAIPSPIIAVEWWRICLDEAQMVECTTTKTAEMALRLSAINRWCVTGTPIQRSINDLYGLLLFLGVDPYWVQSWWTRLLYEPYCHNDKEPLNALVSNVLWRTAKKDVIDQICLPSQTEAMHYLTFSPVEEHFYRRQYHECAREALKKLSTWTDTDMQLNRLDRNTLHLLLHPLLRLRQACCHPQAVRGQFLSIQKRTLTMEELLEQLTKKAQVECEEAHRLMVAAMNGVAALHIIKQQYVEAVEMYREVLRSVEEHKTKVRTDELQQLHTIHNLHEVLTLKPKDVDPTLRDDQLMKQADEIRHKYMLKVAGQVTVAVDVWSPIRRSLLDLNKQFSKGSDWWADLLQWAIYSNYDEHLVAKVRDDLAENASPQVQNMARRFRDARGLQYVLSSHLEQLQTSHETLVNTLQGLTGNPSEKLINDTVECCLRPQKDILKICAFCKADEQFQDYESKLYSFVEKGVSEPVDVEDMAYQVSTRRQGTWADSETEKTIKILISCAKMWGGDRELIEYGGVHLKIFETLKKEFKSMRAVWIALREQVAGVDELDMATTRIRVRLPDEAEPETPQPNIIEQCEFDTQRLKFSSDRIIARNELTKKLGQLLYLQNLAKAQSDLQGGNNPEPCPICQKELGTKWSVLQCGHCYCLECIRILVEQFSTGGRNNSTKCAICRQKTLHSEISYVSTRSTTYEETVIKVKGDHSTKVEGIVHCLLEIYKEDPTAKSLVFSTWTDVLDVLAKALYQNDIKFRALHTQNKFQKSLSTFKQEADVSVLLLPVHSGANGLNLIEATHVLLVEPILNPAQELQAIGRVHRIGQTKPTVVHRFLVRGTIEEKMHSLLQTVQTPVNAHSSEETMLTIGDLAALFEDSQPEDDGDDEELETLQNASAVLPGGLRQSPELLLSTSPFTETGPIDLAHQNSDTQTVVQNNSENMLVNTDGPEPDGPVASTSQDEQSTENTVVLDDEPESTKPTTD